MERKEIFICRKTKEVQMLRGFMAALEIIKRYSAKWDGKCLNKRYTDAMTAAVENVARYDAYGRHQLPAVSVRFETTYSDERTGRIELVWLERLAGVVNNVAVYISFNQLTVNYKYTDGELKNVYNVNGRLVYDKLCEAIDELAERYEKIVEESENAISMADEVIRKYERLNKMIKEELADVPRCLVKDWKIDCAIY